MYVPMWSNILASSCSTCIVSCEASMSLSGLHSRVMRVRCGVLIGRMTKHGFLVYEM